MPLFGSKHAHLRISYLLVSLLCFGTSRAGNVYVRVNDTAAFTLQGTWKAIDALGTFSDHWLIGTHDPSSTEPTTLTFSFDGTGFAVLGTVVNGTGGQSLNLSATLDNDQLQSPTYTPSSSLSDGLDPNSQLFTNGTLTPQIHNLVLTITGETSPFYIQGIAYTPTDHSQSPSSSTSAGPNAGPSQTSQQTPPKSNDAVKLGGAIGGGVGALLLVAIIIFYMMRRIRRIEKNESKLQARPFVPAQNRSARPSIAGGYASSAPTTAVGSAIRSRKEKEAPSQTASIPSSGGERLREKRPLPSSSHSQSNSAHGSQVNITSPPTRNRSTTTPQRSPAQSIISVPSEYNATTVGLPGGTAVASSYIGPYPLPTEDVPPVPAMPGDVKRKSKSKREKDRGKGPLPLPAAPAPPPDSGLGLFSNDSTNSIGTLSRPLPIVPGSRSSASRYQFPAEKVGLPTLSPAPPRRDPDQKRPLPPPS